MTGKIIFYILLAATAASCSGGRNQHRADERPDGHNLIEINRNIIARDHELIISYCERKGITANETPTGLWYAEMESGKGPLVKDGDIITFEYECSLLDGTVCYSSSVTGPKNTRVGYSTIESGLLEGLKMMNRGSEYLFIIPPYLAYGIPGDGNQIPGRSVIVYRIRILSE